MGLAAGIQAGATLGRAFSSNFVDAFQVTSTIIEKREMKKAMEAIQAKFAEDDDALRAGYKAAEADYLAAQDAYAAGEGTAADVLDAQYRARSAKDNMLSNRTALIMQTAAQAGDNPMALDWLKTVGEIHFQELATFRAELGTLSQGLAGVAKQQMIQTQKGGVQMGVEDVKQAGRLELEGVKHENRMAEIQARGGRGRGKGSGAGGGALTGADFDRTWKWAQEQVAEEEGTSDNPVAQDAERFWGGDEQKARTERTWLLAVGRSVFEDTGTWPDTQALLEAYSNARPEQAAEAGGNLEAWITSQAQRQARDEATSGLSFGDMISGVRAAAAGGGAVPGAPEPAPPEEPWRSGPATPEERARGDAEFTQRVAGQMFEEGQPKPPRSENPAITGAEITREARRARDEAISSIMRMFQDEVPDADLPEVAELYAEIGATRATMGADEFAPVDATTFAGGGLMGELDPVVAERRAANPNAQLFSEEDGTGSFEGWLGLLEKNEGGDTVTDAEGDMGGKTQYGVSKRSFPEQWKDGKITHAEFVDIAEGFWDEIDGDALPWELGIVVADQAFLSGTTQVVKDLQRALGVTVDGIMGPKTREAIADHGDPESLARSFLAQRRQFLRTLSKRESQRKWRTGWLNRIGVLENIVKGKPDFRAGKRANR